MHSLLRTTTSRQLTILETLYEEEAWLTISQLSNLTNFPIRTLQHLIPILNEQFHPLTIQHHSSLGYKLFIPQYLGFEYVYEKIFDNSHEFSILEAVFFNNDISTEQLSDLLFISPATVNRAIKAINSVFKEKDLDIKITNFNHQLIGNELAIRNMMFQYLKEKYSLQTSPFPFEQILAYQNMLNDVLSYTGLQRPYSELEFLSQIFVVVITREQAGFTLELMDHTALNNPIFHLLSAHKAYGIYFSGTTKLIWESRIIEQLFAPFLNVNYFQDFSSLQLAAKNDLNLQKLIDRIAILIDNISQSLGITCDSLEKITLTLINHYPLFIGENHILFNPRKEMLDNLATDYPILGHVILKALEDFSFTPQFKWTPASLNESIFIIITNWKHLIPQVMAIAKPLKVLLACTYEIGHAHIIEEMLVARPNLHINCDISFATTFQQFIDESKSYDIIICNSDKLQLDHPNMLYFPPLPRKRDWVALADMVKKISSIEKEPFA